MAVTVAGLLPYKGIIHVVGPQGADSQENRNILVNSILNSMKEANKLKYISIAFPAISTGVFNFPKDISAKCHIDAFFIYCSQYIKFYSQYSLKYISFVLHSQEMCNLFLKEANRIKDYCEIYHHIGLPVDARHGLLFSYCNRCNQTYSLNYFQFSIQLSIKDCDFCLIETYDPNQAIYQRITSWHINPYTHSLCRNCKQQYLRNFAHPCNKNPNANNRD